MPHYILSPKTFTTYSLGCRTNQAEMESISLQLTAKGLASFPLCNSATLRLCNFPDIVLLNTCVVTQKAEKETRQKIRELRKKYPKSFLVVLGCAVTAKENFNINLPEANLFISNKEKLNLLNIFSHIFQNSPQTKSKSWYENIDDRRQKLTTLSLNKYQSSGRKFIKIQDGCDKFCSYCLTCHLRGKPTSISPEKIIEEINFWVEQGVKEIILTGTNIGLYGKDLLFTTANKNTCYSNRVCRVTNTTFLSNKILSETKIKRISFSSIYPEMLTDDFIKLVTNNPRISQFFHLSLQSGSQTVLKRMNRKTDLSRLKQTLSRIKAENPFFTFKADIIAGFPNETEKEFRETLNFIKEAKISFVHSFLFSTRPGVVLEGFLKSGKWKEAPLTIKKQRAERLRKVVEEIRKEEAQKMIGIITNCLIVRKTPSSFRASEVSRGIPFFGKMLERDPSISVGMTKGQNGMTTWEGITENGWPIKMYNVKCTIYNLKGKILPVKISDFKNDQLFGEIISLPTS